MFFGFTFLKRREIAKTTWKAKIVNNAQRKATHTSWGENTYAIAKINGWKALERIIFFSLGSHNTLFKKKNQTEAVFQLKGTTILGLFKGNALLGPL